MKKRRGIPCLLVAALLLFAACSRPGEAETEARLGDFASPEVKAVAFSVYEGGVCEIEIRTEESDAGDWDYHEIVKKNVFFLRTIVYVFWFSSHCVIFCI